MLQGGCGAMPIGARAADGGALCSIAQGLARGSVMLGSLSKRRGRDLVKSFDLITNLENNMKLTLWNIVPVLALTLAAAPVSARAPAAQVAEKTIDGVEKAKDGVVKGVTVATEKTKEGVSKTGEVITDEWITSRVHARFVGEDLLKDSDISVVTSKHVVTLKGTVMGQAGRARATTVAKHTEGVHRVVNQLTIGPKPKV